MTRTPTRWNRNHVSVTVPGGALPWDDTTAAAFEVAFSEFDIWEGAQQMDDMLVLDYWNGRPSI